MRKIYIGDPIKIISVYNTYGRIYIDIHMYKIILGIFILTKKLNLKYTKKHSSK